MALTYRTGSGGKDSALTIEELDNNFRHFTGSHEISGSLIISSSLEDPYALVLTGSMGISGSIIPNGPGTYNLGNVDNYFEEIFVGNQSIIFVSGSTTSSFGVDPSGSLSGSFTGSFDGQVTGSFTGSFTGSVDTQYNSGSCLIGCTSSAIPTGARPEGTFEFVVTGGSHFIYAYIDGGWRSGSLN